MAIRHRFLLLIPILYCAVIIHGILLDTNDGEICSVLCKECNASAVFANNRCECNSNGNDNEGVECIQSLQRDIQTIDLNALSDDFTNEKRSLRSAFESRRRLRVGDAEKVAQYFMNGGASAGHSHFIRGSDAVCDNFATNSLSGTARQSDIEDHSPLSISPLSGSTSKSDGSLLPPGTAPTIPGPDISDAYPSILGMRPTFDHSMNRLYPSGPVLNSKVYPYRKHGRKPHVSLRMSRVLNNLAARRYSPYYPLMDHNPIGKIYPRQDNSPITPFVGQPYGNNNDFNHRVSNNSPVTTNNADEAVQSNIADIPAVEANLSYSPMQYRHLISPYQYIPHHGPLLSMLYSPFDEYIAQAVPPYFQRATDSTPTSVQNPDSYCTQNANIKRQDDVSTTVTNETAYSNEQAKEVDGS